MKRERERERKKKKTKEKEMNNRQPVQFKTIKQKPSETNSLLEVVCRKLGGDDG